MKSDYVLIFIFVLLAAVAVIMFYISQQSSNKKAPIIDLTFFWWVRNVIFFPGNTKVELEEAGFTRADAHILVNSEAFVNGDVIQFFHYANGYDEESFNRYITTLRTTYDQIVLTRITSKGKV